MRWMNHTKIHDPSTAKTKENSALPMMVDPGRNNTASLDVENETKVQSALSHLLAGKTVLVIAHRMRTVAGADRIVVLENGCVAQQGSPAQLMAEGGLYSRMVDLQNESAQWTLG